MSDPHSSYLVPVSANAMNDGASQLIQRFRILAFFLRDTTRPPAKKQRSGTKSHWTISKEYAEEFRGKCDAVLHAMEDLGIVPPSRPTDSEGYNPVEQAYVGVNEIRYSNRGDAVGGNRAIRLGCTLDGLLDVLHKAELHLEDLRSKGLDTAADGRCMLSALFEEKRRSDSRRATDETKAGAKQTELKLCQSKAYREYVTACNELKRKGSPRPSDKEAHNWLKDQGHAITQNPESWSRFVRAVRKHLGTQKNNPLGPRKSLGNSARSIVRKSDS